MPDVRPVEKLKSISCELQAKSAGKRLIKIFGSMYFTQSDGSALKIYFESTGFPNGEGGAGFRCLLFSS